METIRHMALGCCVISAAAGMIRMFWPENSFKPVINAVLAIYIVTAGLQVFRGADWQAMAAQLYRMSDAAGVQSEELSAYTEKLALEASAQALTEILKGAGIEAVVTARDGGLRAELARPADRQRAQALMEENCGNQPYEIITGGSAP